jgi:KipI family sensor histidine kinase inhibitor
VNSAGIGDSGFGIRGFEVQVRDAGDSAILLELEPIIDPDVNARAIAIAMAIRDQHLAGVRDVVPTYRSVAVHFDPLTCDVDFLRSAMRAAAVAPPVAAPGSLVEVPVFYGGEDGPDLDEVAAFAKVPGKTVVDRHSGLEYRVFMLGFLPGFAYMGIVDESIAAPRKATPRTRIPSGSVGIAGRQTGVYPRQSPGGWQLIGRTPLDVFNPAREPAALFQAGDRVRFVPVAGIQDSGFGVRRRDSTVGSSESRVPSVESRTPTPESRSITVLTPGLFTTVQDAGRWGHQDRGVPVSGPMDRNAQRLANLLVGNSSDAATLEATLLGPELRFEQPAFVAVTGADLDSSIDGKAAALNTAHHVGGGSVLRFGERRSGTRAYIAVDGGIDSPLVLGSRSTHAVSGLGGIQGRPLRAGDDVPLRPPNQLWRKPSSHLWREPLSHLSRKPLRFALQIDRTIRGARLRAIRGPQDYYFDESTFMWLERTRFTVSSRSDRMGYRLTPPDSHPTPNLEPPTPIGSMISDATFIGGIQIPPSREPILLMADRQTTGGYPQIATVITADLPIAGQLAPGDAIEFVFCTRHEALAALREQDESFGH